MRVRGRARHALIAVQVGASALLLICAAIFLRGAFAAATRDPGVRTSDTVRVSIDERTTARRAAPGPDGPSAGGGRGRVVADDAWSDRNVRVVAAEPSAGRPAGRVVRILRCARHRCRERARLHAGGTHGGGGRRDRVRDHRAPALAEWRRRRAAGAPRGSAIGVAGTPSSSAEARSAKVELVAHVDGRRRRARSGPRRCSEACTFRPVPRRPETALFLRVRGNPEQARQALLERLTSIDPAVLAS